MTLTLRVLDILSRPSRPGARNEDAAGSAGTAAWVVDGATGVSDREPLTAGWTDAAWLAQWLDGALGRAFARPSADPDVSLAAVEAELRAAFSALAGAADVPPAEQPSACLALAAASGGSLYLASIGDCRIVVEDGPERVRRFGSSELDRLDALLLAELRRLRRLYPGEDPRARVRDLIRRHRSRMNMPGGYWVIHPTRRWSPGLQQERIRPSTQVCHVLVATDGFLRLADVFGAYGEADLLRAALSKGLDRLYGELRALETQDTDCDRFIPAKPFDDASAVLARIDAA